MIKVEPPENWDWNTPYSPAVKITVVGETVPGYDGPNRAGDGFKETENGKEVTDGDG